MTYENFTYVLWVIVTDYDCYNYLRQGVCFRRCFFVCLLATLRKNFQTDLHEIFRERWQWASEQMFKCRWRSGSPSGYRDCFPDLSLLRDTESDINLLLILIRQMTALVRRAVAELYTVPELLVLI